ncbi:MAG: 23S rRNA (pseudouridine(1915)-N(3))-methyltransferase RlmH [bacterium]|nr:23S rRNA (pseudouridine(1915)-N(3))-methyltransferase RlmH [bacterium]MBU1918756.1 23S rRNA (pseudouridine(1915)-N(3))-methyltransferase RlmH [bacterium]
MKSLDFIFIGSPKNKAFKELEEEYHKRIKRYMSSQITTLKDSTEKNTAVKNKKETASILDKIQPADFLVLCDEKGKGFDSKTLANKINSWRQDYQRIVFVIGGAYGFSEDIYKRANLKLKFSDFTLPHELARTVLLEQVYRSFTILGGEKYHH